MKGMVLPHRFWLLIILVLAAGTAWADRLIAPGDRLRLVCEEEPTLSREYVISKDGLILVDFIGGVRVAGLTTGEASEKIGKALIDQRIVRTATLKLDFAAVDKGVIRVTGAIASGIEVPYSQGLRLADVLKSAQPNANADLTAVEITPTGGKKLVVDFARLDSRTNENNPELQPGDLVFVPILIKKADCFVFGGVLKPGVVPFENGLDVARAIERVGGFAPNGDRKRIRLEREGKEPVWVDLNNAYMNLALTPGDRLIVELTPVRQFITIDGFVMMPGPIEYREGMTLLQAVRAAGDTLMDPKTVRVQIESGTGKQRKKTIYDLKKIIEGFTGDVKLILGDKISVLRGGKRRASEEFAPPPPMQPAGNF